MSRAVDIDRWVEINTALSRALRGEEVEVELGEPDFDCRTCSDVRFVIQTRFDGTRYSKRCEACRARYDAKVRKENPKKAIEVPEEEAPPARDWKQAAGFDVED